MAVTECLNPLYCEHFGKEVDILFNKEAWDDNAHRTYDQQTHTLEENKSFENNNMALLNSCFYSVLNYSSSLESNSDQEAD